MNLEKTIILCKKQKKEGFRLLYEQYHKKMFGLCLRYCKNTNEAEDLLHDGFIKTYSKIINYNFYNEKKFIGWMSRIFVNLTIDRLKENKKHNYIETEHLIIEEDYFIKDNNSHSLNTLLKMVNELPSGYRIIFNMHCIEGYSHKEIANSLNITVSTSTSQLSRAKKILQEKLISKTIYHEA